MVIVRALNRIARSCLAAAISTLVIADPSQADEYETTWVEPGQSRDVYWSINLSGRVYVAADVDGRPACLEYWWIVWPFTQIKPLGRHCGRAVFPLPGYADFAVGGKLRAGGAGEKTRIRGTSVEAIAHKFPEIDF